MRTLVAAAEPPERDVPDDAATATSMGDAVIAFANNILRTPLTPWQGVVVREAFRTRGEVTRAVIVRAFRV